MKIVPKILAVGLAVSLNAPRKVEAIPIVIAPLVCAKVCVLIGTAVVGGVTSYVWHHRTTKKKYLADAQGNVRKMLADPDEFEQEQVVGKFKAVDKYAAVRRCQFLAKKQGKNYVDVRKSGDFYECIAK